MEAIGDGLGSATREDPRLSATAYDSESHEEMASIAPMRPISQLTASPTRCCGWRWPCGPARRGSKRIGRQRCKRLLVPAVTSSLRIVYMALAAATSLVVQRRLPTRSRRPRSGLHLSNAQTPRLLGSETPFRSRSTSLLNSSHVTSSRRVARASSIAATYFVPRVSFARFPIKPLQALGANLDIKDLEYKNMDDPTTETTTTWCLRRSRLCEPTSE